MINKSFKQILTDHMGYKVLATLMTLILWVSVMIRRDYMVTKSVNLELQIPTQFQLVDQTAYEVLVKIEGPRNVLHRYLKSKNATTLFLNLETAQEGLNNIVITVDKLNLPPGIRLLSLAPNHLRFELKKRDKPN